MKGFQMILRKSLLQAAMVPFVALSIGSAVQAQGAPGISAAVQDATVHFGHQQPQTGIPAAGTHLLLPDEVTIHKNGTVNFIVNGGGHGIAIHEVAKQTTRADIAADFCGGNAYDTGPGNEIADRVARSAVCNGAVSTVVDIGGVTVSVLGTQNLNYQVVDGKGNLVINPGFNVNAPPVVISNPRVDDPVSSPRLLATSGASPGDVNNPPGIATNPVGGFLTGTAAATTTAPNGTPGARIQVQFTQPGRYLVVCMNRGHLLNDHMFGFVNVVDAGVATR